jgi:oligosaccharide repeat unit polymerase
MNALIALSGSVLLAVFLLPFVDLARGKIGFGEDVFRPDRIAAVLLGLRVVPFFAIAAFDLAGTLDPLLFTHPSVTDPGEAVAVFGLLQAVSFLALIIGVRSGLRRPRGSISGKSQARSALSPLRASAASIIALLAGFGLFSYLTRQIGGLDFLLANIWAARLVLGAGMGYVTSGFTMMFAITMVGLLYGFRNGISGWRVLLTASTFIVIVAVLSTMGGRGPVIQLLFICVLTWHYCVRRFIRFPRAVILAVPLVAAYLVVLPTFRGADRTERMVSDPSLLIDESLKNAQMLARGNEYVSVQALIVSHFGPGNLWHGASFLGLLTAPIPRSMYRDKPPVDDGMYIHAIATGRDIRPPAPVHRLAGSAWPPSTFGAMFANFWIPGVLLGYFLLGRIYSFAYRRVEESNFAPEMVLCYAIVMWTFQLSTLGISTTAISLLIVLAATTLLFRVRLFPSKRSTPSSILNSRNA